MFYSGGPQAGGSHCYERSRIDTFNVGAMEVESLGLAVSYVLKPTIDCKLAAVSRGWRAGCFKLAVSRGCENFHGERLHVLQIGLGTNKTFIQHLTGNEWSECISWLLESVSENSASLRGVGVEPASDPFEKLVPELKDLSNATLVQAAIGRENGDAYLHTISDDEVFRVREGLESDKLNNFDSAVSYLRNMSCVGCEHPLAQACIECIKKECGGELQTQRRSVPVLSYERLHLMLNISGTELLIIDAEGYDCRILLSMIEYCSNKAEITWPSIIQFETQGWCDTMDGPGTESAIIEKLQQHGYFVGCSGLDTVMIRSCVVTQELSVQKWLNTELHCSWCQCWGWWCVPLSQAFEGFYCKKCASWDKEGDTFGSEDDVTPAGFISLTKRDEEWRMPAEAMHPEDCEDHHKAG